MSLTGCPPVPWNILTPLYGPTIANAVANIWYNFYDPSDTAGIPGRGNGTGNAQGTWGLVAELPLLSPACQGDFAIQHVPNGCVAPQCGNSSGAIGWPQYIYDPNTGNRIGIMDFTTVQFEIVSDVLPADGASRFTGDTFMWAYLSSNVPGIACFGTLSPAYTFVVNGEPTNYFPEEFKCSMFWSNIWNLVNPPAGETNEEFDAEGNVPGAIIGALDISILNPYALEWKGSLTLTYPAQGCVVPYTVMMPTTQFIYDGGCSGFPAGCP